MLQQTSYESLSSTEYATTTKALLELTKNLRAIGAQTDVDLPRIVVIGNQSAGKSSVVESISGISVPRDSSTCTRCPMECRLSNAPTWSAQVYIRWEHDRRGHPVRKVTEAPFGPVLTTKAQLELVLRQAQLRVLSEHVPDDKALEMTRADIRSLIDSNKTLKFSRNIVCIDVHGPDLTDLAFIDLPGIIQNAEDEQVKLVEDIVVSHIQGNSLILVTLPMTDDLENQKAMRLARLADPKGNRTIGVLTKPDLLGTGSNAKTTWLDILEGRRSALLNGYYCTRHPDDAERDNPTTAARARESEKHFFEREAPWRDSLERERFGIPSLISNLSHLLIQVIETSLPGINEEVDKALSECTEELTRMPKALDREPSLMMLHLISQLHQRFKSHADGSQGRETLVQDNRITFRNFKKSIRGTVPNFWPYVKDAAPQHFKNSLEDPSDEGADDGVIGTKQPFYLDDMRCHLERALTRELPGHIPYPAVQSLIQAFQTEWPRIAERCTSDIKRQIVRVLDECVKEEFARWPPLQAIVRSHVHKLVEKKYENCMEFIECLLENERTPFTQNDHYSQETKRKWLAKYKDANAGKTGFDVDPQATKSTPFSFAGTTTKQADEVQGSFYSNSGAATPLFPSSTDETKSTQPQGFGGFSSSKRNTFTGKRANGFTKSPFNATNSSNASDTEDENGIKGFDNSNNAFARPTSAFANNNNSFAKPSNAFTSTPQTPSTSPPFPLFNPGKSNIDPEAKKELLAQLARVGFNVEWEDLGLLNPLPPYQRELEVMAEVRSYFQVAYKRVIDCCPMTIDNKFVRGLSNKLQEHLMIELGLGGPDASARCARYLAEDPRIQRRREELEARKERLQKIRDELDNFGIQV